MEHLFFGLTEIGYKILLRDYECDKGKVAFIAKKNGELVFVGVNTAEPVVRKIMLYYLKRYGILNVPTRIIVL
jgi:Holliday junction resolvase-like predicted endonuclease